ncbi:hypothetical protein SDC9_212489 [bioreactor metagenome]|uniref:Uncharacterized protein n=1 Tax=bioreactor metagenome TaxID=1076179 RepID=A0A645K0M3_9ZZZZ
MGMDRGPAHRAGIALCQAFRQDSCLFAEESTFLQKIFIIGRVIHLLRCQKILLQLCIVGLHGLDCSNAGQETLDAFAPRSDLSQGIVTVQEAGIRLP